MFLHRQNRHESGLAILLLQLLDRKDLSELRCFAINYSALCLLVLPLLIIHKPNEILIDFH